MRGGRLYVGGEICRRLHFCVASWRDAFEVSAVEVTNGRSQSTNTGRTTTPFTPANPRHADRDAAGFGSSEP
ncbi:hypothetical protein BaRGS_00014899 [Batillaria attramentaria]|uniref:Uncharacterized protein n=1 Tax=Batillaria attramentaria TaxID=370345 RepID=A0ABD0L3G1_9CAEN